RRAARYAVERADLGATTPGERPDHAQMARPAPARSAAARVAVLARPSAPARRAERLCVAALPERVLDIRVTGQAGGAVRAISQRIALACALGRRHIRAGWVRIARLAATRAASRGPPRGVRGSCLAARPCSGHYRRPRVVVAAPERAEEGDEPEETQSNATPAHLPKSSGSRRLVMRLSGRSALDRTGGHSSARFCGSHASW